MGSSSEDEDSHKTKKPKTVYDQQRIQLEKLMANPNKEVVIPELKDDPKKPRAFFTHEFVRNVMGASAGAGSGEFDIYRGCRRREMIRQEFLEEEDKKKKIREEFERKQIENKLEDDARTAKKREKRLKAKQKLKNKKGNNKSQADSKESENEENTNSAKEEEQEELLDLTEKVETELKS